MTRELFKLTRADGTVLNFAHLTTYDLYGRPDDVDVVGLVPLYLERQKKKLLRNCRAAGLDPAQTLVELDALDKANAVPWETLLALLNEPMPGGVQWVLEYCWKQTNPTAELPPLLMAEWEAARDALIGGPLAISFNEPTGYGEPGDDQEAGPEGNALSPQTYAPAAEAGITGPSSSGGAA